MLEDFIFSLCINFSLIFSGFVGARGFEHLIYYNGLIIAHFLGYPATIVYRARLDRG